MCEAKNEATSDDNPAPRTEAFLKIQSKLYTTGMKRTQDQVDAELAVSYCVDYYKS